MQSKSTEIAEEQAYFDLAAKHRSAKLAGLDDMMDAAANKGAALHLRKFASIARAAGGAGDAVAFARIDADDGECLYVGRQLIRGDNRILVLSWQAPAAAPYYEASHSQPHGLIRKRTFRCTGNHIDDFTDIVFAEIAEAVDKLLLAELARGRTGEMRDIVATIQAAQFDIIRAPLDSVLVIEGGPGTGKTAVALHRVSWLLFHQAQTLRADSVLVVGPNATFVRYIAGVLPGLGETEVVLRDVASLAPAVARGRVEPPEGSLIKGSARMAGLLARALEARIGVPEPAERLAIDGRFVTLPGTSVAAAIAACRTADLPYSGRRQLFRDRLVQLVADRTGAQPPADGTLANLIERLWPQQSAAAFLRDLFGSRNRLRSAAGDEFTRDEVKRLQRRGADRLLEEIWSPADLPLLDELEYLINGPGRRYAHIVVDEAQDLSPMQLRSVARRSATGSVTIVGDIAQSTGAWARDGWDDVTRHLPATHAVTVAPLRYGYRVPRQVYQLASKLLPVAAPGVRAPEVVRDGPAEPGIHRVSLAERAGRAVSVAMAHAAAERFVGVVCPPRCRREIEAALADNAVEWSSAQRGELGSAINLVSPHEAKGLEFDAVVVVEPEQIVAADERGHRLLYVALTRTTGYLDIVCAGDPLPLSQAPQHPGGTEDDGGDRQFTQRDAARLADHLAAQVRSAAPDTHWDDVLQRVARLLQR